MRNKQTVCSALLLVLVFSISVTFAELIAYYPFEEGSGDTTADTTGNGNDGTLASGVEWVEGYAGGGVHHDTAGERIVIGPIDPSSENDAMTLAAWINWEGLDGSIGQQGIIGKRRGWTTDGAGIKWYWQAQPSGALLLRADWADGGGAGLWWGSTHLVPYANEWAHVAVTWDDGDAVQYINAEEVATGTLAFGTNGDDTVVSIGSVDSQSNETFMGIIDEVRIYDTALSQAEIAQAMTPGAATGSSGPTPAAGATDVRWDVQLGWLPGDFAAAHDVYFGMSFDDVNSASRANPGTALVSEGQAETTYIPGKLALNTAYYWRVDEVNSPPDSTIFKGAVWDFTTEPISYAVPIGAVSAVASSEDGPQVPDNTVNGSGLSANDEHSTLMEDMWVGAATDMTPWIQFDFGSAETFDKVHIWNHNTQTEGVLGFGIKEALIETSLDGETWTEFGTFELAQASGVATYPGFDLPLDGIIAQHIKVTALSNWSLLGLPQKGLSEVRFYTIPVLAREPMPADRTASDGVDVTLMWRPGREVDQHEVVFSDDRQAVADNSAVVGTVDSASFDAGTLDLGSQYFWKINEVNDVETPSVNEGDLWMFTTPEEALVEDFERYKAEEGLFIWEYWIDGFEDNSNGSIVGNGDDPEKTIVFEGKQSLPMAYDNTSAALSEATRTFDTAVDLTTGNPESLIVQVRGAAPGFLAGGDTLTVGASGIDIWNSADDFRFVYKRLSGDGSITAKIESCEQADVWTKAGIMIRENLGAEAANSYSFVTPTGRVGTQWRQATFNPTVSTRSENEGEIALPYWVRLTRTDNMLKGEHSADGATWSPMFQSGTPDLPTEMEVTLIPDVYIGLAVTSHNVNASVQAVFSNVSTTGNVTGSWTVEAIGDSEHPANDPAPVYLRLADTAGKEKTFDHPNPEASIMTAWDAWTLPLSDLSPVDPAKLDSITVGVSGAGVTGKIFVDAIRTARPFGTADLLAQYPLDGDTLDASGNGHDGVMTGAPVFIDGAIGQGLEFNGIPNDQYVDLGTWDPAGPSEEMSISLWAKWNGLSGEWQGVIGKRNAWAADNMMWDVEIHQTNGTLYTHLNGGQTVDMGAFPEAEWTHVALTYDGATAQIYSNGDLAADGAYTFGPTKDAALVLGCCEAGGNNPFNGALDEVRLYGRKLSAEEVSELATLP